MKPFIPSAPEMAVEFPAMEAVFKSARSRLAHQLLQMEIELNSNIPTTLWISDLHGEGDRFKLNPSGPFRYALSDMPRGPAKHIQLRQDSVSCQYHPQEAVYRRQGYTYGYAGCNILPRPGSQIQTDQYPLPHRRYLLPEFHDIINRLLSDLPVPDPKSSRRRFTPARLIAHLSHTIRQVLLTVSRFWAISSTEARNPQDHSNLIIFFL